MSLWHISVTVLGYGVSFDDNFETADAGEIWSIQFFQERNSEYWSQAQASFTRDLVAERLKAPRKSEGSTWASFGEYLSLFLLLAFRSSSFLAFPRQLYSKHSSNTQATDQSKGLETAGTGSVVEHRKAFLCPPCSDLRHSWHSARSESK
jgi:hypothetical protein